MLFTRISFKVCKYVHMICMWVFHHLSFYFFLLVFFSFFFFTSLFLSTSLWLSYCLLPLFHCLFNLFYLLCLFFFLWEAISVMLHAFMYFSWISPIYMMYFTWTLHERAYMILISHLLYVGQFSLEPYCKTSKINVLYFDISTHVFCSYCFSFVLVFFLSQPTEYRHTADHRSTQKK